MEDFVICLDLLQRVDLLLAALAHLRARRLDFLYDCYVRREWYGKVYLYELLRGNGRITRICVYRMYDGLCKERCSKRDMYIPRRKRRKTFCIKRSLCSLTPTLPTPPLRDRFSTCFIYHLCIIVINVTRER